MSDATDPSASPFSMSDAAGYAFRKRDRRFVLLAATLTYVALMIVLACAQFFVLREVWADYFSWTMTMGRSDAYIAPPQSVLDAIPAYLLFALLGYVLLASFEAACLRWLVRGEAGGGLFGLRLDADTARVFVTYLCWVGLFLVAGLMLAAVAGVLIGLSGGSLWIGVVASLLFYGALIFLGVRFAPASAAAIARRRISFLEARKITRGRFWALFGAFAFYLIIFIVGAAVAYFALGMSIVGAMMQAGVASRPPDPAALQALMMQPNVLASIVALYAIVFTGSLVLIVAFFGINAYAVRGVTSDTPFTP